MPLVTMPDGTIVDMPEKISPEQADKLRNIGNIDLSKRPIVQNKDGTISTIRSISINENGKEILIPTISPDGKILSNNESIDLYHKTGQHLGKFNTIEEANNYAEKLHNQQANQLSLQPNLQFTDIRIPTPQEEALYKTGILPDVSKESFNTFVEKGALPTAGTIIGGMAGAATPIPGGEIIGQSLGAGGGELLNQALGITEPSWSQVGINAAIPPATRAIAGTGRWLLNSLGKNLPGASVALQEQALRDAQNAPNLINLLQPSKPLYDNLKTLNPDIQLSSAIQTADNLIQQEGLAFKGLDYTPVKNISQSLLDKAGIDQGNSSLPFQQMWENIKRLGRRISQTRAQGGEEYGAYKKLYSSMWEDLNNASDKLPQDVGDMLKEANNSYRREMARQDLADQITKSIEKQAQTSIPYVRPKMVYNWLTKSKDAQFFKESMTPEEYNKIVNLFDEMIKTPPLKLPPGVNAGSYRMIGKLALGSLGGYAATGNQLGALAGATLMTQGPEIISRALMTDTGRALLKQMISKGFSMDYTTLAILAEAVGSQFANMKETNLMGDISKIKTSDVTPSEMSKAITAMKSYKSTLSNSLKNITGVTP